MRCGARPGRGNALVSAARGGLAVFGYPLTEEFAEVSAEDGQPYTVQYFERARFEHHPEHAGTAYEVLLGHLGRALAAPLAGKPAFAPVPAPVVPPISASPRS